MNPLTDFKLRCCTLVVCVAASLLTMVAAAQTCFEGNCVDGYGKKDFNTAFYVGAFSNEKFNGPGLRYSKDNGAITMSYWQNGERSITVVEFQNGNLEFGYRTKSTDGKWRLHNGFDFTDNGLRKKIDGQFYPLDFKFGGDACLIGDCNSGLGAEYLITVSDDGKDTASYLFVGHYNNGNWDGEGGYYEFSSGDFFVGHFSNNIEWNGGYFNEDSGLATFLEGGQEAKVLSYSIPAEPPGVGTQPQAQAQATTQKPKKKGGFWKTLGEVAVGTVVVAAAIASENNTSGSPSGSSSGGSGSGGSKKINCKYMVEWWTEANDTKLVIEGVAIIKATNVEMYKNAGVKGQLRFFNTYLDANNFKQEKANTGISEGYEIGYKPVFNEVKLEGCAN